MRSLFQRCVQSAIRKAVDALLEQQDKDGFWHEFDLKPGPSDAWTTAWVGWCLCRTLGIDLRQEARIRQSCRYAASVVWSSRAQGGWGYNRSTGPDADTTAWVLRFLSSCGYRVDPTGYLAPYVDPGGGVHTFRELDFGAWTDAHDDVAANAGLALATSSASRLIAPVRERLVQRFPIVTYWWSTSTYGLAWCVRFLNASGGLPCKVRSLARSSIFNLQESESAFEAAHQILAVLETEQSSTAALALVNRLLDLAGPQGWEGSSCLLVPGRKEGEPSHPNPEVRALLTTSICARVLSEWIAFPLD
jgi:hypothetical protein